ncbi:hypothetical protein CCYA_CCYA02G0689 [Cyanidiococcus yangmingshanensis]|nr:hypothetical protein CCYA_CCYA02G0689 [Cyanidiococcus yangmingshanensis]
MAKQVVPEEEQERVFRTLLAEPENSRCAECAGPGPRWASANLGIFLCIQCSGLHRKLGVHVSQVRSVNLDRWTAEQLNTMKRTGNRRAAAVWEAQLPPDFTRPVPGDTSRLQQFIWNKYVERRFYSERAETLDQEANAPSIEDTKQDQDGLLAFATPAASVQTGTGHSNASGPLSDHDSWSEALLPPYEDHGSARAEPNETRSVSNHHMHLERKRHILAMYGQGRGSDSIHEASDTPSKAS